MFVHAYDDCFFDGSCGNYSKVYVGPIVESLELRIKHAETPIVGRDIKLNGTLWGVSYGYVYDEPCGIYANFDGLYDTGRICHRRIRRQIHEQEYEGRLGWNFMTDWFCCGDFEVTPYVGLGFRYNTHSRNNKRERENELFPKVRFRTWYVPVGVLFDYCYNECFNIGLNLEWMPQINSDLQADLIHGVRFVLKDKYGYKVELPLTYNWDECWSFSVVPYYKYVKEGRSSTTFTDNPLLPGVRFPEERYSYWGGKFLGEFVF